jgi:cell division protein FtsI (penicillin-binding protein 3)
MPGMDAIALLEKLGMKVKAIGVGKVKKQSLQAGQNLVKNTTILLELS